MTKSDRKYMIVGTLAGIGLFFGAWWMRKIRQIPVLAPTSVQWEGVE